MTTPTEVLEAGAVFDNDPNKHRYEGKVFRLTFGMWGYRRTFETVVFGNCPGFDNLSCAISNVADLLPEGDWGVDMSLANAVGDTLHASSEDEDPEDWLLAILVSAEIIAFRSDAERQASRRGGEA